jgi:hypothetical protein
MSAEPEFSPAHILGKIELDYLDAEEALRSAKAAATEAKTLLPPTDVDDLEGFERDLFGRIELLSASDFDIRDLLLEGGDGEAT